MKHLRLMIVSIILLAVGCQPTPYQRLGKTSQGGYSDKSLGDDLFLVRFSGNPSTSLNTMQEYLYRRAAEVTLKYKYKYYSLVRSPKTKTTYFKYHSHKDQKLDMLPKRPGEQTDDGIMLMIIRCYREVPNTAGIQVIDANQYLIRLNNE